MAPQWTDFILSSDIPNCEGNVFVFNSLNIKSNSRDGGHNLSELKLVEDGGLTGGIQTHHKDSHLPLAKKALKQTSKYVSHLYILSREREKHTI
eukprot:m.102973 g.102973  ORF g.102973 m.102973 type:complete len:94 (-) comp9088_c1_seq1:343-624(-)